MTSFAALNRVPAFKDGQYFYLDAVIEQLHYWGVNTDDHRLLMAEHVIKELRKMADERAR